MELHGATWSYMEPWPIQLKDVPSSHPGFRRLMLLAASGPWIFQETGLLVLLHFRNAHLPLHVSTPGFFRSHILLCPATSRDENRRTS